MYGLQYQVHHDWVGYFIYKQTYDYYQSQWAKIYEVDVADVHITIGRIFYKNVYIHIFMPIIIGKDFWLPMSRAGCLRHAIACTHLGAHQNENWHPVDQSKSPSYHNIAQYFSLLA